MPPLLLRIYFTFNFVNGRATSRLCILEETTEMINNYTMNPLESIDTNKLKEELKYTTSRSGGGQEDNTLIKSRLKSQ